MSEIEALIIDLQLVGELPGVDSQRPTQRETLRRLAQRLVIFEILWPDLHFRHTQKESDPYLVAYYSSLLQTKLDYSRRKL